MISRFVFFCFVFVLLEKDELSFVDDELGCCVGIANKEHENFIDIGKHCIFRLFLIV